MADTQYVNQPGGVIVHLTDGTSEILPYGAPVPENVASYVDTSQFSDGDQRVAQPDLALQSAQRAALADGGQPNSSSSSVPTNFDQLDEDTIITILRGLTPGQQAEILVAEKLNGGGRQKILDAATPEGRAAADALVEASGYKPPKESKSDDADEDKKPAARGGKKTPDPSDD